MCAKDVIVLLIASCLQDLQLGMCYCLSNGFQESALLRISVELQQKNFVAIKSITSDTFAKDAGLCVSMFPWKLMAGPLTGLCIDLCPILVLRLDDHFCIVNQYTLAIGAQTYLLLWQRSFEFLIGSFWHSRADQSIFCHKYTFHLKYTYNEDSLCQQKFVTCYDFDMKSASLKTKIN